MPQHALQTPWPVSTTSPDAGQPVFSGAPRAFSSERLQHPHMQQGVSAECLHQMHGAAEGAGAGPLPASCGGAELEGAPHLQPQLQPLLFVDVNIAPGQPMQRLCIYEGQSAGDVACEFAARHALAPGMAQRLHKMLDQLMQHQEQMR